MENVSPVGGVEVSNRKSFPFLWIGLALLAVNLLVNYFTNGLVWTFLSLFIAFLNVLILAGLAKLFKAQGSVFNKSLFIASLVILPSIYQLISKWIQLPGFIPLVLGIGYIALSVYITKKIFELNWGKTIGLIIVNAIVSLILIVILSPLIGVSLLSQGANNNSFNNNPAPTINTTEIQTWRTIKLGTYKDTASLQSALKNAGYIVDSEAKGMLSNIPISQTETTINLALVRASQLGIDIAKGYKYSDVLDKATGLGLGIAPAEVGPQLRLQYPDQMQYIFILMEPIGNNSAFYLSVPKSLYRVWTESPYFFGNSDATFVIIKS